MTIKQISTMYDHAREKDFLVEKEGLQFLKDIQESMEKDGLKKDPDLAALIITVSAIPREISNAQLGEMLRTVASA